MRVGQRAVFGVDFDPDAHSKGAYWRLGKAPGVVQDVVTYTVMISAPNSDGLLLPGMTADVRIMIEDHTEVLVVPQCCA